MSPGPRIAGRPHVEVSRWGFMLGVLKVSLEILEFRGLETKPVLAGILPSSACKMQSQGPSTPTTLVYFMCARCPKIED